MTDRSDNGDDSDGETEDDETVTLLNRTNLIEATKVASVTDNNSNGVTDLEIRSPIRSQHSQGTVTLSGVTIADTIVDGNSLLLPLQQDLLITHLVLVQHKEHLL